MAQAAATTIRRICRRLAIDDPRYVEIESKRRVLPDAVVEVRDYLRRLGGARPEKTVLFFDQFLDTPELHLFRKGASLRLRYKGGGRVYLQYKGPGFTNHGALYRSEFSSYRLRNLLREESRHDIVHFAQVSVREILTEHAEPAMAEAMHRHLGDRVIGKLNCGNLLCAYHKEKFSVDLGPALLEPSLDQVHAFHIGRRGPHPVSSFWELENEIKARRNSTLEHKLEHLDALYKLDADLSKRFSLAPEPLDKYHRCTSFFATPAEKKRK
jgi:hypothetical protein